MGLFDGLKNQSRKPKDQEATPPKANRSATTLRTLRLSSAIQMFHVKQEFFTERSSTVAIFPCMC